MKYIVFENRGLIDLRAITTFGVSVKITDSPIGYFGTGLKYAIAVSLRTGQTVEAFVGKGHYKFTLKPTKIRNSKFQLVYINDEEMGFTSELGKNWELWMAFREFYSNCLDESGEVYKVRGLPVGEEDTTKFIISGDLCSDTYSNRYSVFLDPYLKPILSTKNVDIYEGHSGYLFYKGVRVMNVEPPFVFTYNVKKQVTLTEDRTVKYDFMVIDPIVRCIVECGNKDLIREAITAIEHAEKNFDFTDRTAIHYIGEPFLEVVGEFSERSKEVVESAMKAWTLKRKASLYKQDIREPTSIERAQIARACAFCEAMGFPAGEYPILILKSLGTSQVHGEAYKGKIYLTEEVFVRGTKYLADVLMEEYIHLKYGYLDESREMQNLLFKTLTHLGETYIFKEPL